MGYYISTSGGLTIDPPLTYAEIQTAPQWLGYRLNDAGHETANVCRVVKVTTNRENVETPEGPLVRVTGVRVDIWDAGDLREFNGDLQALVDAFPGHRWRGVIGVWGEDNEDMRRVYVRDGKVIEVRPQIVWPDPPASDTEPEI